MNPVLIVPIITAIEQLVGFIVDLKRNGQLSDADIEQATTNANQSTRDMIAKALAEPTV